jgi:hypothetical protein
MRPEAMLCCYDVTCNSIEESTCKKVRGDSELCGWWMYKKIKKNKKMFILSQFKKYSVTRVQEREWYKENKQFYLNCI